jgi:predicted  nucleic acid-binding Zn-ribbon protein
MSESEPLDQNVKKAEKSLAEEKKQVEAEKTQARERTAADQKELEVLRQERTQSVSKLPKQALFAYEKIRKKWSNTVVAEAANGRCSACQINLRPQFLQDLRKGDQLMFCESCGRFLYFNPPVSCEDAAAVR